MGVVGWWGVRGHGRGSSRWRGLVARGEMVVMCIWEQQQQRQQQQQQLKIWQQQWQQRKQQQAVRLLRRSE
jgi:hypothetical protein